MQGGGHTYVCWELVYFEVRKNATKINTDIHELISSDFFGEVIPSDTFP